MAYGVQAAPLCTCRAICCFRILAYRLQADRLGDLDTATRRQLDRIGSGGALAGSRPVALHPN
jgi:hypothetical protein